MTDRVTTSTSDEVEAEICPDYHTCRNGAKCVESPLHKDRYYCDCDALIPSVAARTSQSSSLAGVSCEHKATVYCNEANFKSYTSFCTNQGKCKAYTTLNGKHAGCECPPPYTGEFCEFLVGQQIPEHIANEIAANTTASSPTTGAINDTATENSSNAWLLVTISMAIVIVLLITTITTICCLRSNRSSRRSKSFSESSVTERQQQQQQQDSDDNTMLEEAMKIMQHRQNPPQNVKDDGDEPPMDPTLTNSVKLDDYDDDDTPGPLEII